MLMTESQYRGVTQTPEGRFIAAISRGDKLHYLGTYDSEQVAAMVYDVAAFATLGDCAILNFPDLENELLDSNA